MANFGGIFGGKYFFLKVLKKGLVLEKNELFFCYTFRKIGGGGADPNVKNVKLFFNEGFPYKAIKITNGKETMRQNSSMTCFLLRRNLIQVIIFCPSFHFESFSQSNSDFMISSERRTNQNQIPDTV